jgi:hypothetical protein
VNYRKEGGVSGERVQKKDWNHSEGRVVKKGNIQKTGKRM